MVHVFAHQGVRTTVNGGRNDVGIIKRQVVLLSYFKRFGVGGYSQ